MAKVQKKTVVAVSARKRLNMIIKAVAQNPEGCELVALARREKIRIVLSGKPKASGALGLFNEDEKRIDLERSAKDKDLAEVLAHELRHLWQSRIVSLDTNGLSAVDSIVQRRVTECDAFAYQIRFQLFSKQDDLTAMKKTLRDMRGKKKSAAARKAFNKIARVLEMKAFFLDMQSEMDSYDKQTLKSLRLKLDLAKLCVKQRELLDQIPSKAKKWQTERSKVAGRMRKLYNEIAHPRPLDKKLLGILREGLTPESPTYFQYKNVDNLAAFIRRQIPQKTLKEAASLEKEILTTIKKAGMAPVRRAG